MATTAKIDAFGGSRAIVSTVHVADVAGSLFALLRFRCEQGLSR